MDVALIFSGIACLVGVFTFILSLINRAKNDGVLVQKINQLIDTVDDLKADIKEVRTSQQSLELTVTSHEEQIKTLFRMSGTTESVYQALNTIADNLNHNRGSE